MAGKTKTKSKAVASKSKATTKKVVAKKTATKSAPAPVKPTGWKWATLLTLSLAMFIIVIDTTIMNVSISSVVETLDTTVAGVQGAIAMYALVMAAFILPGGKLGDIWGKKKTFLVGLVLFTIGTLTASYATNLAMLILGWSVIEGIGGALMMPQIQGMIRTTYSGKDRALAYGIIGGVIASGAAFGPIIGGLITDSIGWWWAFRLEAIVALVVFLLSPVLKNVKVTTKVKLDMKSVWLNATGMILVVLGVLLSTKYGFIQPRQPLVLGDVEIAPFGLSISIFMVVFGLVFMFLTYKRSKANEAAKKDVLFKPSLFKNKQLTVGLLVLMIQAVVQMGILFGMSVFLQAALNLNAVDTGIALLPMSLSIFVVSFLSPSLGAKFYAKSIIGVGFLTMALGLVLLDTVIQTGMTATDLIPGLVVFGVGVGLLVSQVQNLVLSAVDEKDSSEATGLNGAAQQFGNAIGTAVFGTFIIIGLTFGLGGVLEDQGLYDTQSRELLANTVKTDINNLNDDALNELLAAVPQEVVQQIEDLKTEAEFNAMKTALGLMAGVAVLGFLVSLKLPAKKLV